MDIVFFVYGLSFFLFGIAVFFQVRKGSEFRIGKYLWLLAMFGLLHGLNEWLDMFLMLHDEQVSEYVPTKPIKLHTLRTTLASLARKDNSGIVVAKKASKTRLYRKEDGEK